MIGGFGLPDANSSLGGVSRLMLGPAWAAAAQASSQAPVKRVRVMKFLER